MKILEEDKSLANPLSSWEKFDTYKQRQEFVFTAPDGENIQQI